MTFFATLAFILLVTQLVSHLCVRMEVPDVIGQIIVGIIIGPAILNWVKLTPMINEFQELGVVILMFIAGLESDLSLLKKYLKPAVITAIMGVLFPVVFMGGASLLFGFNHLESLFIGVIFSATSVSISVAVMREFHVLDSKEGATILGAAVADDIIGVILLSLMIGMIDASGGHAESHGPSNIFLALALQVLFFVVVYLLVRWLAPILMRLSEHLLTMASNSVMAMIICLSMAGAAEAVGLSGAVGAFFAGLAIANTHHQEVINHSFIPIGYSLFIPVFFVSIGLNMRFDRMKESLLFVIVMTILAVLTKLFGCGIGARMAGLKWPGDYVVGSGMVARGEMSLITAQIGFSAHLLSKTYYSDIIAVIVLATVIAPFLLKHSIQSSDHLMKQMNGQQAEE